VIVPTRDLLVVPTNRDINPIFGIKPGAQGAIAPNSPFVQWQIPKGAPDVPSPLIHDGLVYFCTAEVGKVSCADLKTGKLYYSGERIGDGRYRASLVYADGHIADELLADAVRSLRAKQGKVKFLGSYPASGEHAHTAREHADARWREADDWVETLRAQIE
jgi:hypothetical protein